MPSLPDNTRDYVTIALMVIVVLASAADVAADLAHGASTVHVTRELLLAGLALILLGWVLSDRHRQRRRLRVLQAELEGARQATRQRSPDLDDASRRLGEAVQAQFGQWGLSPGEQEVGWLLLKGLSIREIASLRETAEKTVRQQASAIYRKAQLPGRHAFAAWFLEDLL